ncbi:MAG: HipA domain-containing protein [Candidatus Neomarinimicrobiota bacterium]
MTEKQSCRICCQPLQPDEINKQYHRRCCHQLFGQATPPELPYALSELNELAKQVVRSRITIPGVQAKLSLFIENSRHRNNRFTIVGLWGNFILKPPVKNFPEMPEIEHLTMLMAEIVGIKTVPNGLIALADGELAYITRRIDRDADNGKIHMEDMCQLTGRLTENKYQGSYEQIGTMIKNYSSNPLLDCQRLLEVLIFSYLTGNTDMHLKNFSLIYAPDGMIQLSPAYDLLSTRLLISEKDDPDEMALTLNGKKRRLTPKDFQLLAERLGMNKRQYENILAGFVQALPKMIVATDYCFLSSEKSSEFKTILIQHAERLGI